MTDRAVAHVKTIHGEQKFRVGRLDLLQRAVLPLTVFLGTERERDLDVEALAAPVADKIDLLLPCAADRDLITPPQELEVDHVFQQLVDITAKTSPHDRVAQARIRHIELLVHRQNAFADQVLTRNAGDQKRLLAGREVIQHRLH